MRDIALFLIFLLTILAGFPCMAALDRFMDRKVKASEEETPPFSEKEPETRN